MYEVKDPLAGSASFDLHTSICFETTYLLSGNFKWIFKYLYQHFSVDFPRHLIFANFQCIRCGRCCGWDGRHVYSEDIIKWIKQRRYDILSHVICPEQSRNKVMSCGNHLLYFDQRKPCQKCHGGDIIPSNGGKCPFIAKVRNRPYYRCTIQDSKPRECSEYSCEKSLSVSYRKWNNVEELIQKIGIQQYLSLIAAK